MKPYKRNILITGGAGFIGSHLVKRFVNKYPDYRIVNFDLLTYAGNLENVADVADAQNYTFVQGDVADLEAVRAVFRENNIDGVIHCAAESHVDRSIEDPLVFIRSNVLGTAVLLQVALEFWGENASGKRFHHISTDEVYGSLGETGKFTEESPYDPRSPYSASKAASDHMVRAWGHTYGLPVTISNCSNNYGPNQYPEKLIPVVIQKIKNQEPIPVYGTGANVRDWLHVEDHVDAVDLIFHEGHNGETYNVGGDNEWTNIDLVRLLCTLMDEKLGNDKGTSEKLITFVEDRKGHDLRYAIDDTKLADNLFWRSKVSFPSGLKKTLEWYSDRDGKNSSILL